MEYYKLSVPDSIKELKSSESGLSEKEAERRLSQYGLNKIQKKKPISPITILLSQFKSILVIILIIAAGVSLYLGETIDFIVIVIIVIVNSLFGFWQEFKAEKAIEALEKITAQKSNVLREGKISSINSSDLVPGDIVLLEEGDKTPADCRLIEAINLKIDESSLTGESNPIIKTTIALKSSVVADRRNSAFMGTSVVGGRGKAIVAYTGMKTEIGKIATEIQAPKTETPLQIKLKQLGSQLGIIILIISAISSIAAFFILHIPPFEAFKTGIALAVAAIPEGLPAVATLTLAIGVRRMSKNNAIVRRLSSVETLGECSIVCSDKTGTITKNQITAKKLYTYYTHDAEKVSLDKHSELLLRTAMLCNDAVKQDGEFFGDPTETALLRLSTKHLNKKDLDSKFKRIKEIPFSSESKRMTIVTQSNSFESYSKGAVEKILDSCDYIYKDGKKIKLTPKERKKIEDVNRKFTENALRVLAFAYKPVTESEIKNEKLEDNLIFLGLIGMIDPPRDEAAEAISLCKKAGIRVVMMTGDHALTAKAIGNSVGLKGNVITGAELELMNDDELNKKIQKTNIFARVSPHHKLKILEALKSLGYTVSMTGDGINDAPALKKSDIGVAMGIKGTDVAKEASDMVLKDDNFATIVSAVKEGRVIYSNIKKFIQYLLSANMGEVLVIFSAILISSSLGLEYAIPLTAIQILWLNLITDGLPALALGVDPPSKDLMFQKPRPHKEKILTNSMLYQIIGIGFVIAALTLIPFYLSLDQGLQKAQTIAFTTLVILELARAQTVRMKERLSFFSNKYLVLAIGSSLLLQLSVLYIPALQTAFKTQPLLFNDWILVLAFPTMFYLILWLYYKIKFGKII